MARRSVVAARKRESHDFCVKLAYWDFCIRLVYSATEVSKQQAASWQRRYKVKGVRTLKVPEKRCFGFGQFLKEKREEKGKAVLSWAKTPKSRQANSIAQLWLSKQWSVWNIIQEMGKKAHICTQNTWKEDLGTSLQVSGQSNLYSEL